MEQNNSISIKAADAFIRVGEHALHFKKIGKGAKLILAFHGYGNDASLFSFLEDDDSTIISFDMPFQGESHGKKGWIIKKQDIVKLVEGLMHQYEVSKLGLVGFSLGARVCLCIAEELPQCIRNIVLIAPDGLRPNHFYNFLTNTRIGRSLFKGFVRYGALYVRLFTLFYRMGILSRYRYQFVIRYIRTVEGRSLLYDIWLSTSHLLPNHSLVRKNAKSKRFPIHILMGNKDKVIPLKNASYFKSNYDCIHIHVFERGHNMLDFPEVKGMVAAWLFRSTHNAYTV